MPTALNNFLNIPEKADGENSSTKDGHLKKQVQEFCSQIESRLRQLNQEGTNQRKQERDTRRRLRERASSIRINASILSGLKRKDTFDSKKSSRKSSKEKNSWIYGTG